MKKNAIILFSGGLDSTTCLGMAKAEGFSCYTLSFAYGQKHQVEVEWAKNLAHKMGVIEHKVLFLPLDEIRGSSLTDPTEVVPDYKGDSLIPTTYVPARNTIFLSFGLAWAEVVGAQHIFLGVNAIDYSGYPDCRPEYIIAFETMANLATKMSIEMGNRFKIHTPLLRMNKADIIRAGIRLGLDYSETISCYRADERGRACGSCDSCVYRKKGFFEASIPDPTPYYA